MRLGLLADIHEAVAALRAALQLFRRNGVDKILHLGDVCRMHHYLPETCRILEEAGLPAGVLNVITSSSSGVCQCRWLDQAPGWSVSRFTPNWVRPAPFPSRWRRRARQGTSNGAG